MIKVYPGKERYSADHGWLKTAHSFSFADYYDPSNMEFGALRVLNDDYIAPSRGFGEHPHREMEIVTIVLKGYLQHKDSSGGTAVTTFGGVQRMSAGTGVSHSEMNPSAVEEVNLLQLWFTPGEKGLKPSYEQTNFDVDQLRNQLLPVVSKQPATGNVALIHQDMTIYLSNLDEGKELTFTQEAGRRIFLFVIEGDVTVNDAELNRRDSARITGTPVLKIAAASSSQFMLIDLP